MQNKTVIQQLIETLEEKTEDYAKQHDLSDCHIERKALFDAGSALTVFVIMLKQQLEAEKEMIKKAYIAGGGDYVRWFNNKLANEDEKPLAEKYYNKTFKTK